jgi:peptidoglycan/LPS O-acetylase OafA/YrhL
MKLWRLEAVRGAAAAYVTLSHVLPAVPVLFSFGQEAVMVFFLLSGFVIEYSSSPKLDRGFGYYFGKRFLRIYSVLLCLFVVAAILQKAPVHSPAFWRQLCGNLLMLQDFSSGKPHVIVRALFSGVLWSLHYEWWFYMLYFPVASRLPRAWQMHAVGLTGIAAAIRMGVVMAQAYADRGRVDLKSVLVPSYYLGAISLVLSIGCLRHLLRGGRFTPGLHPFLELQHVGGALAAAYLALAWQHFRWLGFRRLVGWGCWIAPISYALYIGHQPLLAEASYLHGYVPAWIERPLYLAGLLAFCYVTEQWLYRRLNRWYESLPRRAGAAGGIG